MLRNGFVYVHKRYLANGCSTWECTLRRKGEQCKAQIKISSLGELVDEKLDNHSHSPSQTVSPGIKRKHNETEQKTSPIIVDEEVASTSLNSDGTYSDEKALESYLEMSSNLIPDL